MASNRFFFDSSIAYSNQQIPGMLSDFVDLIRQQKQVTVRHSSSIDTEKWRLHVDKHHPTISAIKIYGIKLHGVYSVAPELYETKNNNAYPYRQESLGLTIEYKNGKAEYYQLKIKRMFSIVLIF